MNSEIARAVMYTTCINHLCVSASPHSNSGARSTTASVELAVVQAWTRLFPRLHNLCVHVLYQFLTSFRPTATLPQFAQRFIFGGSLM